jgi:hypothetical protein
VAQMQSNIFADEDKEFLSRVTEEYCKQEGYQEGLQQL